MTISHGNTNVEAPSRDRLLDRVATRLMCPDCKSALHRHEVSDGIHYGCPSCSLVVRRADGQLIHGEIPPDEIHSDWLNRIKEKFKRKMGSYYPWVIRLLSPVCGLRLVEPFVGSFETDRELVADFGAGTGTYTHPVVCVDGVGYPSVHVVADLERLPFQDDSFAGILSFAVLEHTRHPQRHVREMHRLLRPGGRVLCFIPFIQGYHASPHDYQRYTVSGIQELFGDFEILRVGAGAGPTSGMIWIVQEWLAIAFSFGSERLYRMLVPLTWLLSPLKYLDLLLVRHPAAHMIASGFFIEARKKNSR